LNKGVIDNPNNAKTAMRASIVTQILCHVYAYMNNLEDKEADIHSGIVNISLLQKSLKPELLSTVILTSSKITIFGVISGA
jgi:hypothetical protein